MARAKVAEGGIRGFALDPLRNFKREEVVVPEWDGAKVIVRALSAGDWVEYRKRATELILVARQAAGLSETPTEGEEAAKEESVEVSSAPLYAFVLTRTLFDESGARVFGDGDVEEVAEAFSPVHDLLVSKAFELSGIAADADAPDPVEAAGND